MFTDNWYFTIFLLTPDIWVIILLLTDIRTIKESWKIKLFFDQKFKKNNIIDSTV